MLKIDRMEFPKKYPIPNWIKLMVIVLVIAGVFIHNCTQDNLLKEIKITDVQITEYSKVHVEVDYTIANSSKFDRDVRLLLRVYDKDNIELGSTLFLVNISKHSKKSMLKIIDKLSKPIDNENRPFKATIEIYRRKVI